MLQCLKPFLFILDSFFRIEQVMPCSGIVNKATSGKKLRNRNKNGIDHCKLDNRHVPRNYLIRSNIGANGNRHNFSSRVKTCMLSTLFNVRG